jgi:hypothetical protein
MSAEIKDAERRILNALLHTPMKTEALAKWCGMSRGSTNKYLANLVNKGRICKPTRTGPYQYGPGENYTEKSHIGKEPDAPMITEQTATGRVVRFGIGWKPGRALTAPLWQSESSLNGIF